MRWQEQVVHPAAQHQPDGHSRPGGTAPAILTTALCVQGEEAGQAVQRADAGAVWRLGRGAGPAAVEGSRWCRRRRPGVLAHFIISGTVCRCLLAGKQISTFHPAVVVPVPQLAEQCPVSGDPLGALLLVQMHLCATAHRVGCGHAAAVDRQDCCVLNAAALPGELQPLGAAGQAAGDQPPHARLLARVALSGSTGGGNSGGSSGGSGWRRRRWRQHKWRRGCSGALAAEVAAAAPAPAAACGAMHVMGHQGKRFAHCHARSHLRMN